MKKWWLALILLWASPLFAQIIPTLSNVSPSSGPVGGGNQVILTGTNFYGASIAIFGNTQATITSYSSTAITCTAPAGSLGTIYVYVRNGFQASGIQPYTYGSATNTPTFTPTNTFTKTNTPTNTGTNTPTWTPTNTFTGSPTNTFTPTPTRITNIPE